jgi:hypothetical protein
MQTDRQLDQDHFKPMRVPTSLLIAALIVALGASLFWGVQQSRELTRAHLGAASLQQTLVDMDGRLKTADRALNAAEASLQGQHDMNLRRIFPEGRPTADPATIDQFNAALDSDPVWDPFYRKLERRRIISRYNILVTALKIPHDKLVPLEDLLVERAITSRRIAHHIRNSGRNLSSPESIAAVGQATDDVDARINKLVGDNVAKSLKEWNSAVYLFGNAPDGIVAQDAVTLNDAGFELSSDQLVKLALIRHEVYLLHSDVSSGDKVDAKSGLTAIEETLLKREAEVLSPEEIAVLRDWAIETHHAQAALRVLKAKYHIESDRGL